jgi:hypothetical protein
MGVFGKANSLWMDAIGAAVQANGHRLVGFEEQWKDNTVSYCRVNGQWNQDLAKDVLAIK